MNPPCGSDGAASAKLGDAETLADGRIRVRFERRLPHAVERVWAALVEPAERARWFPEMVSLEPRPGGHYRIEFAGREGSDCSSPTAVRGTIERFEAPYVLQCGTMLWELAADPGGCILRFSDVVEVEGPRSANDTARSVLGGWHWYLDALEAALAGRHFDRNQPEVDYRWPFPRRRRASAGRSGAGS